MYGGTGFFVTVPTDSDRNRAFVYLVTAKHCVEKAKGYSNLFIRLNARDGGYQFLKHDGEWFSSDNDAIDVAVSEFAPSMEVFDYHGIRSEMFATQDAIDRYYLGIGDDVFVLGLFTERYGTQRNIPIARSGIIAAMPEEPLRDLDSGLFYDAYLTEVRSIGGLSGSPVFVMKEVWGEEFTVNLKMPKMTTKLFLLGLIRGHWDYEQSALEDFTVEGELRTVNKGIATVTPATDLLTVLNGDELMKRRRRVEREHRLKSKENLNSAL